MGISATGSTDRSLIRRVQAKQPRAWEQFVELYGPCILDWARRFGLSFDDAADVAQETFAAVSRGIEDFRRDAPGGSLRGWMWTIVRNKTRDLQRRRRVGERGVGGSEMHDRLLALPEQLPDDSDPAESLQVTQFLRRGLAQVQAEFEPRTWQAFWLVIVEGNETEEVARRLEMKANHVRQCRSRVLRRLREHLNEKP